MWTAIRIKIALVVVLIAAVVVGGRPVLADRFTLAVFGFGLFNVVFAAPGTDLVRVLAIAGTVLTLLFPTAFVGLFAATAVLIWPPAFAVSWALAHDPHDAREALRARIGLATLIVAVAVGVIAYRMVVAHNLQQTAALFVGIPAILAIVVVFGVSPDSAAGVACKAVTLCLLVSAIFLWEGVLCILMSAPLFFAVAIVTSRVLEEHAPSRAPKTTTLRVSLVLLAIVPMSLEGVTEFTTVHREESVSASQLVAASPDAVARALFAPPRFDRLPPLALRAGFPSPIATRIERTAGDTRWVIQIRGGELLLNGMEPRTGELTLVLEEARPGLVRWRAASDTSHMTHFLMWREIVVEWRGIDAGTTRVTWTLRYRRGLDPAWYFGPMERYASRLAAGYLIDAVATP